MTRHTWRPGDAIDPGATYYPMDGARQRDPLEPDDVIAALDAYNEPEERGRCGDDPRDARGPIVSNAPPAMPPIEPNTVYDSSAEHWSHWLPWRGGPCPLPGDVVVEVSFRGEHDDSGIVDEFYWDRRDPNSDIIRFRYRADNPAGWLPRGGWIPPAELWDEGCPVRLHIRTDNGGEGWAQRYPRDWDGITHIRLVARQPQAGLPEGFEIRDDGVLVEKAGVALLWPALAKKYGPAAIRQAVAAWLREMGDG